VGDRKNRARWRWDVLAGLGLVISVAGSTALPTIAAWALLYPYRRVVAAATPQGCQDVSLAGAGVRLSGWRCPSQATARGTLILLHGVADNRAALSGVATRFMKRGLNVIAYDSRAHGSSGGEICTYGYFEKLDLRRVIDSLQSAPVVVLGTSLGGAVALQEAADDPRVAAVAAAEVFSDLRTIARERAPFLITDGVIARAFKIAESRGTFSIDAVDVTTAARRMTRPVLLVHGAEDRDTSPDHSQRVYAALAGPKQLILVPGVGHNQSLSVGSVWNQIETWVDTMINASSHTTRH
jgi:alpha-beta hydrolase superfamily lysophospholipase